jgi:hypothetical protein
LTHSLKATGFNHCTYYHQVMRNRFQAFAFHKRNLHRYAAGLVKIRSTGTRRTVQSAQSLVMGLYPPPGGTGGGGGGGGGRASEGGVSAAAAASEEEDSSAPFAMVGLNKLNAVDHIA